MKKHSTSLTVRYQETDRMGVVYYGNYFTWFEVARTEYLKACGLSYRQLEEKKGLYMMVVDARCIYKLPATYDDNVTIETWVSNMKFTSMFFDYRVLLGDIVLATGQTAHVFTDGNKKPVKIPEEIKKIIC